MGRREALSFDIGWGEALSLVLVGFSDRLATLIT